MCSVPSYFICTVQCIFHQADPTPVGVSLTIGEALGAGDTESVFSRRCEEGGVVSRLRLRFPLAF